METIFENLENVVQLLAVAQSKFVSQWDDISVDRAFRWTRYCETLYTRFHDNPRVRQTLEGALEATNAQLRRIFHKYRDVTFTDLSQCHSLLLMSLISNPAVSHSVSKYLFGMCEQCVAEKQSTCNHSSLRYLEELIGYKAAAKLLYHSVELKEDTTLLDPEIETQGKLLSSRLDASLSLPDPEHRLKKLLDCILEDFKHEKRGVVGVLAAAILTSQHNAVEKGSQDVILEWLEGDHELLRSFCQDVPIALLVRVAQQSATFRKAYLGILNSWVCAFEYDINGGEWFPKSENAVSFDILVNHFKHLFAGGPSLKDDAEHLLTAVKIADGNFEVKGLSVSGDILNKLKK